MQSQKGKITVPVIANNSHNHSPQSDPVKLSPNSRTAHHQSDPLSNSNAYAAQHSATRISAYAEYSALSAAGSGESRNSRRGSGESSRSRRDSVYGQTPSPGERIHRCRHHQRRQSQQSVDLGNQQQLQTQSSTGSAASKYYRSDQRPSASSTDSAASSAVRWVELIDRWGGDGDRAFEFHREVAWLGNDGTLIWELVRWGSELAFQ